MKLFFTTALVTVSLTSFAQNFVGIKGAYSVTTIKMNSSRDDPKSITNLSFGISFDHNIKKGFSIGAELLYERRGCNPNIWYRLTQEPFYINSRFQCDYLTAPIKVNYQYGKKFFGVIGAGVIPGLLLKSEMDVSTPVNNSFDLTKETHKFDLAGMGEIGAGYKIGTRTILTLSARYQYSVTNSKPNANGFFSSSTLNQTGTAFFIGGKFKL